MMLLLFHLAPKKPMGLPHHEKQKSTYIAQIIKICVVSSFTENNLHPRLNSLVPIIAIDPKHARICLYDVLLLSEEFQWINHDKDVFNYAGATLLWAMINHRYVTNNVRIFCYSIILLKILVENVRRC